MITFASPSGSSPPESVYANVPVLPGTLLRFVQSLSLLSVGGLFR